MKHKNAIRLSSGDLSFVVTNYAVLALILVCTLYPLLFVISASFSDPQSVSTGQLILWPIEPSLDGYKYILQYSEIWTGYANTIFYTFFGTALNLAFTLPCAYALSRKDMPDRGVIMTLFIITMYFSGGMIPAYLNVRSLGLLNSRWAILLVGLVSTYNLIVARSFFANTVPWELHEASFLDGASDFRTFMQIVLPLSMPIIVVMTLYYGVAHWNGYFNAMIYLRKRSMFPLQLFLREILTLSQFQSEMVAEGGYTAEEMAAMVKQADIANMIKYCVIVVATAPMMALYPFLQKFFVKGVMIGAVKG